ncbi:hypothetical protein ACX1HG_18975 [Yersinia enterocolitica]
MNDLDAGFRLSYLLTSDEYFKLVNLAVNQLEVWAFTFENEQLHSIHRSGVTVLSQKAELLIERNFDYIWRYIPVEYEML